MASTSIREILAEAIRAEADGYHFYMMAAGSSSDPMGKKVFQELADEELAHLDYLKLQLASMEQTGAPDTKASLDRKPAFKEPHPIFSPELRERLGKAHYEMSALSVGAQLELAAMRFYTDAASRATEPVLKDMFEELASWEKTHYDMLLGEMKNLRDDYWAGGGFSPF